MSYGNPKMRSVCKWMIIAGSLIFYAPFGARNVLVLLVSIAVNAAIGAVLAKGREGQDCQSLVIAEGDHNRQSLTTAEGNVAESAGTQSTRIFFWLGIVLNVALLLFFKFSGNVLGDKVFFPIAISFYTFNQISFLAETYKGETSGFSLADYLAYILFFPKIVQGPLMGYVDFRGNLEKCLLGNGGDGNSSFDWEMVLRGLYLFSMGLFKKVIMADTFGKAVDVAYTNVAGLGSLEAAFAAVFYSFQLYFDFSGYCDMATGICMIMGFDLSLNFNSPYKAVNIVDFWKRWHITLTKFFTKYVYIPLGGNRRGVARMYLNFMVVFLVSGLWHGNGWQFIVWGALHGVLFVITRALDKSRQAEGGIPGKSHKAGGKVVAAIKVVLTFIYVTVAWVFFRAPSIKDALPLLTKVFPGGIGPIDNRLSASFQLDELWYIIKVTPIMKLPFAWDSCLWLFLIVGVVMIFFCKNAITIAKSCRIGIKTTLITVFLLIWSIVSFAGVRTFLYMNF